MRDLLVSEIFGPTFQGEGRSTGQQAVFLRLGGCNLHCSWCDTPYTWSFDKRHADMHQSGKQYDPRVEMRRMSFNDIRHRLIPIAEEIYAGMIPLLVISGGEPMLQQERVLQLLDELWGTVIYRTEIETAGTIKPYPGFSRESARLRWNVSPKLEHSGNSLEERYKPEALQWLAAHQASFKFVVQTESDFYEIERIIEDVKISPKNVWIMPEGTDPETILDRMRKLSQPVLDRGWNMTTRLHTLLWNDERGR